MQTGKLRIAGTDEAGRGCLAGPVVAAAVILGDWRHPAINDSKKLSAPQRAYLYGEICAMSAAWAVSAVEAEIIDTINILQASRLAMAQALAQLSPPPDAVLVDALVLDIKETQQAVIHGDAISVSIAAASILAKVTRDRIMIAHDLQFPGYGFARHKGYGTRQHFEALQTLGPTALHRMSFAPLRESGNRTQYAAH
jgi:ribonuclease HII